MARRGKRGRKVRRLSDGKVFEGIAAVAAELGVSEQAVRGAIAEGRECRGSRFEYVAAGGDDPRLRQIIDGLNADRSVSAIATELDISQGMVSQILSKANLKAADFRKQKRTRKSAKVPIEIECDRDLYEWLESESRRREIPVEQIVLEILASHKQQERTGDKP